MSFKDIGMVFELLENCELFFRGTVFVCFMIGVDFDCKIGFLIVAIFLQIMCLVYLGLSSIAELFADNECLSVLNNLLSVNSG